MRGKAGSGGVGKVACACVCIHHGQSGIAQAQEFLCMYARFVCIRHEQGGIVLAQEFVCVRVRARVCVWLCASVCVLARVFRLCLREEF